MGAKVPPLSFGLADPGHLDAALLQYLAYDQDKVEKVLENPTLLRTPPSSATENSHGGLPAGAVENLGMTKSSPFGTPLPLPKIKLCCS